MATQSFPQFLIRPFSLWQLHAIDLHLKSHTQQGLFFTGYNFGINIIQVIILLRDRCTIY